MGLIKMAAAGVAGYALYKYATKDEQSPYADGPVRNAGPANMQDTPKSWSKTDEALDESFPASDPPANY
ncbi:hypothetical protein I5E68_01090 [Novosphingobium sp. YJ-S2-02]|uniref:Uncharacterized protein n=1 Tax=Novosphingobium aureum TaxID=2792964 RepID=A0A931H8Y8_9SPHN|nr:hypothetical protein [Novosphingobium aureum]MBH0111545.1 hypothetical protein [Novosphingobium aureum]